MLLLRRCRPSGHFHTTGAYSITKTTQLKKHRFEIPIRSSSSCLIQSFSTFAQHNQRSGKKNVEDEEFYEDDDDELYNDHHLRRTELPRSHYTMNLVSTCSFCSINEVNDNGKIVIDFPNLHLKMGASLLLKYGYMCKINNQFTLLPYGERIMGKLVTLLHDILERRGSRDQNTNASRISFPSLLLNRIWDSVIPENWDTMYRLLKSNAKPHVLSAVATDVREFLSLLVDKDRRNTEAAIRLYQTQSVYVHQSGLASNQEHLVNNLFSLDLDPKLALHSYEVLVRAYEELFSRLNFECNIIETMKSEGAQQEHIWIRTNSLQSDDKILVCQSENPHVCLPTSFSYMSREHIEAEAASICPLVTTRNMAKTGLTRQQISKIANNFNYSLYLISAEGKENNTLLAILPHQSRVMLAKVKSQLNIHATEIIPFTPQHLREFTIEGILLDRALIPLCEQVQTMQSDIAPDADVMPVFVGDFRTNKGGDLCSHPDCGNSTLNITHVSEIARIRYFPDTSGVQHLCHASIDLFKLLVAVAESSYDERGILWPLALVPFRVMIVRAHEDWKYYDRAVQIYNQLEQIEGYKDQVLFYDVYRNGETLQDMIEYGFKIGIPYTIVVGRRSDQGRYELIDRSALKQVLLTLDETMEFLQQVTVNTAQ